MNYWRNSEQKWIGELKFIEWIRKWKTGLSYEQSCSKARCVQGPARIFSNAKTLFCHFFRGSDIRYRRRLTKTVKLFQITCYIEVNISNLKMEEKVSSETFIPTKLQKTVISVLLLSFLETDGILSWKKYMERILNIFYSRF